MATFGVYVHFPYCLKKCPYCDFASYPSERADIPHTAYADAVLRELRGRAPEVSEGDRLATVFFGGGTPSLWQPDQLGRVVAALRATFDTTPDLEVTVECNPTSLDQPRAEQLLAQGVTRLSIGVQSLSEERLAFLGRLHHAEGGLAALRAAKRAGFERLSADLIFGVAGGADQSAEDARREAEAVAAEGLSHVSAYGLTIEPGTRFGELHRKGKLPVASDERIAESYLAVEQALIGAGLGHYEISNYAAAGQEARHNLGYWQGRDYLGLGAAAVGTLRRPDGSARRQRNLPTPGPYLRAVAEGARVYIEEEELDRETRMRERLMLGLRLEQGLDLGQAAHELGVEPFPEARERAIRRLVDRGQLLRDGDCLRIPPAARVFTDGIAAALF